MLYSSVWRESAARYLHAELGEIVIGDRPGRESDDEVMLLNSMGRAVIDGRLCESHR